LPAEFADIPVDRLEQARAWLQQQPRVDADRIGVIGVSKGAEFALPVIGGGDDQVWDSGAWRPPSPRGAMQPAARPWR
jgi:dienelactone hydrolase